MSFNCENTDTATRAFISRISMECRPYIKSVTVPFYVEQFGEGKLCGSGVLLQIGSRHFVATAAHTFDARKFANVPIYTTSETVGERLIPFDDVLIRYSETKDPVDRTDDPFDLCVCELPAGMAQVIGRGKRYLNLMDVHPLDRQHPQSWYFVFGYPTAINPGDQAAKVVTGNAVALGTFLYLNERGDLTSFDKEVGIALDFDAATMTNDAGESAAKPSPKGMSGCGIWRLAEAGCSMERWRVEDIRLVAIQHARDPNVHVLKGTRIRYALQMIYRNHPDLRDVLEMHYPGVARLL